MAVHLIKLSVGAQSTDDLKAWHDQRGYVWKDGAGVEHRVVRHITRNTPKRAEELLAGGSLYWIIKGKIQARNEIIGFEECVNDKGKPACGIIMKVPCVETLPKPHRGFQGWRYFDPDRAPKDLNDQSTDQKMPAELQAELNDLGLL